MSSCRNGTTPDLPKPASAEYTSDSVVVKYTSGITHTFPQSFIDDLITAVTHAATIRRQLVFHQVARCVGDWTFPAHTARIPGQISLTLITRNRFELLRGTPSELGPDLRNYLTRSFGVHSSHARFIRQCHRLNRTALKQIRKSQLARRHVQKLLRQHRQINRTPLPLDLTTVAHRQWIELASQGIRADVQVLLGDLQYQHWQAKRMLRSFVWLRKTAYARRYDDSWREINSDVARQFFAKRQVLDLIRRLRTRTESDYELDFDDSDQSTLSSPPPESEDSGYDRPETVRLEMNEGSEPSTSWTHSFVPPEVRKAAGFLSRVNDAYTDASLFGTMNAIGPALDSISTTLPRFAQAATDMTDVAGTISDNANHLSGSFDRMAGSIEKLTELLRNTGIFTSPKSIVTDTVDKIGDWAILLLDLISIFKTRCWRLLVTWSVRCLNLFGIRLLDAASYFWDVFSTEWQQSSHPRGNVRVEGMESPNLLGWLVALTGVIVCGRTCSTTTIRGLADKLRLLPYAEKLTCFSSDAAVAAFNLLPETVTLWLRVHFPVADWWEKWFGSTNRLYKILDRIEELNRPDTVRALCADMGLQDEILAMNKELRAGLLEFAKNKGSQQVFILLKDALRKLDELTQVVQFTRHTMTARIEPFAIWFYGTPGVGKSTIVDHIIRKLCPPALKTNMIYSRTISAFHDKYNNQFCYKIDDFGVTDRPTAKGDLYLDFISAVGNAVVPLEMSNATEKGSRYFCSPLVAVTSNMAYPVGNGVADGGAPLFRRRHLLWETLIRPEFAKPGPNGQPMIDRAKIPSWDFTDHYVFKRMDPTTPGSYLDTHDYTFTELWQITDYQFQKHISHQFSRLDDLEFHGIYNPDHADSTLRTALNRPLPDEPPYFGPPPPIRAADQERHAPRPRRRENVRMEMNDQPSDFSIYLDAAAELPDAPIDGLAHIAENDVNDEPIPILCDRDALLAAVDVVMDQHAPRHGFFRRKILPWIMGLGVFALFFGAAYTGVQTLRHERGRTEERRSTAMVIPQTKAYDVDPKFHKKVAVAQKPRHAAQTGNATAKTQVADASAVVLAVGPFRKATYLVTMSLNGRERRLHAIAVKGTTILTVAHFFFLDGTPVPLGTPFTLMSQSGAIYHERFDPDRLAFFGEYDATDGTWNLEKDACLYRCSFNLTMFRDITHHFMQDSDVQHHSEFQCMMIACGLGGNNPEGKIQPALNSNDYISGYAYARTTRRMAQLPVEYNLRKKDLHALHEGWMYKDLPTDPGHCGAMVIAKDTSVVRKIVGIHIASHLSQDFGFAEGVTQEDLRLLYSILDTNYGPDVLEANDPTPELTPLGPTVVPEIGEVTGNAEFLGLVSKNDRVYQSDKPSHIPGPLFGLVYPPLKGPSVLSPRDPRIQEHGATPLRNGIAKYMHYIESPNARHVEAFGKHISEKFSGLRMLGPRRVLTIDEACTGLDYPHFDSLVMQTSPGYPWIKQRPSGSPGKSHWFTCFDGERPILKSEKLRAEVLARIENARNATRTRTLSISTLKAELRSHAKIAAAKTRVFTVMPMDYTIAYRMYFLSFAAFMYQNCNRFFSAVGINPESLDWTQMADRLLQKSPHLVDADFADWDGWLHSIVIEEFANIANRWYDDGPENALIRKVLIAEACKTYHLTLDLVFMTIQGLPSGFPTTSLTNSVGNYIEHGCAWMLLAPKELQSPYRFDEFVEMRVYGDDVILAIAPEAISFYNMQTIADYFHSLGISYTPADKILTAQAPSTKDITACQFLKRGFRKEMSLWKPLMDYNTITELTNWIRLGNPNEIGQCNDNCNEALKFAYFYGRKRFEKLRKEILLAAALQYRMDLVLSLYDWDTVHNLYYHDLTTPTLATVRVEVGINTPAVDLHLKASGYCAQCGLFTSIFGFECQVCPARSIADMLENLTCHCFSTQPLLRDMRSQDKSTMVRPSDLEDGQTHDVGVGTTFRGIHVKERYPTFYGKPHLAVVPLCFDDHCDHSVIYVADVNGLSDTGKLATGSEPEPRAALPTGHRRTMNAEGTGECWSRNRRVEAEHALELLESSTEARNASTRQTLHLPNQSRMQHPTSIRLPTARPEADDGVITMSSGTNLVDQTAPGSSQPPTGTGTSASGTSASHHADVPWDLNALAEKLTYITTINWSTSQSAGTGLFAAGSLPCIPWNLLTTTSNSVGFKYMNFWRGDVEIHFRLNGTNFHCGTLSAFFVPLSTDANITAWQTSDLASQSIINNVLLDAATSTPAVMRIAWPNPKDRINLTQTSVANAISTLDYLGHLQITVMNPLLIPTGGQTTLSLAIFARFLNNEFTIPASIANSMVEKLVNQATCGYACQQMAETEDDDDISTVSVEEIQAAITATRNSRRRAANVRVEMLTLAKVAAGAIAAKHLPKLFGGDKLDTTGTGLDKPAISATPPTIIRQGFDNFTCATGMTNTTVLDIHPEQQKLIGETAQTVVDEMSISELVQKPTYIGTLAWNSTHTPGTQLQTQLGTNTTYICPFPQGLTNIAVGNFVDTAPCQSLGLLDWIARFGAFWSGSIVLRVRIVTSQFATGRLAFSTHNGQLSVPSSLAARMGQYSTVLDLGKLEHQIDIPFLHQSDTGLKYMPNGNGNSQSLLYDFVHGVWACSVLVPLRIPQQVADMAYVNLYWFAGPDFKIYTPNMVNMSIMPMYTATSSLERRHEAERLEAIRSAIRVEVDETTDTAGPGLAVAPTESSQQSVPAAVTMATVKANDLIIPLSSLRDLIKRVHNIGTFDITAKQANFPGSSINAALPPRKFVGVIFPHSPQAWQYATGGSLANCPSPQHLGMLSQLAMMFRGWTGALNYYVGYENTNVGSSNPVANPFGSRPAATYNINNNAWQNNAANSNFNLGGPFYTEGRAFNDTTTYTSALLNAVDASHNYAIGFGTNITTTSTGKAFWPAAGGPIPPYIEGCPTAPTLQIQAPCLSKYNFLLCGGDRDNLGELNSGSTDNDVPGYTTIGADVPMVVTGSQLPRTTMQVAMCAGDDFRFFNLIGLPPLWINGYYAPLTGTQTANLQCFFPDAYAPNVVVPPYRHAATVRVEMQESSLPSLLPPATNTAAYMPSGIKARFLNEDVQRSVLDAQRCLRFNGDNHPGNLLGIWLTLGTISFARACSASDTAVNVHMIASPTLTGFTIGVRLKCGTSTTQQHTYYSTDVVLDPIALTMLVAELRVRLAADLTSSSVDVLCAARGILNQPGPGQEQRATSRLNTLTQHLRSITISYEYTTSGPPHEPAFKARCNFRWGRGYYEFESEGTTKHGAKEQCACEVVQAILSNVPSHAPQ